MMPPLTPWIDASWPHLRLEISSAQDSDVAPCGGAVSEPFSLCPHQQSGPDDYLVGKGGK
jgi:hypothetical protein